jgi:hypothetical protein
MKRLWLALNIGLVVLALWGGYGSMTPKLLRQTNTDAIPCLIILIIMPIFALRSVSFSIRRSKCETLRRPSWDRNAFNWWFDPLQSLFISTFIASAMAIGSAFRLPSFGSVGFWTLGIYCCCAVGLVIGQFIVYRIYRERITEN